MKFLKQANKIICRAEMLIMGLWFTAVFFAISAQVVMRYVFSSPLMWSDEFSRYSFVWIIYLGCAYCVGIDNHARIPFLYDKMPPALKKLMAVAGNIAALAVFCYIIPNGYGYAVKNYRFTTAMMHLPMTYLYLVLPAGCGLTALQLVIKSILIFDKEESRLC